MQLYALRVHTARQQRQNNREPANKYTDLNHRRTPRTARQRIYVTKLILQLHSGVNRFFCARSSRIFLKTSTIPSVRKSHARISDKWRTKDQAQTIPGVASV